MELSKICTIYQNGYKKLKEDANYITVKDALNRIKKGKSKDKVLDIRQEMDSERKSSKKLQLPSVIFTGKVDGERIDANVKERTSLVVLDFDHVKVEDKKEELKKNKYIFACWVSPSGDGVKALVKIADTTKHRLHYESLLKEFDADSDPKNKNESRLCFESYDPDLYLNEESEVFTKYLKTEKQSISHVVSNSREIFEKLIKWSANKGSHFTSGNRNQYIFLLSGACCRFGVSKSDCESLMLSEILSSDPTFKQNEALQAINSGYKQNASKMNTERFENEKVVNIKTGQEVVIDNSVFDLGVKPKDILYADDVIEDILDIYRNGYKSASTTFIPELDTHFKFKKGEITLLTGIGNHGKSTFLKYLLLLQAIGAGKKFAIFSPEEQAHEFYLDLADMYFGCSLSYKSAPRPSEARLTDFINSFLRKHFFFIYPSTDSPTPEYVKERFLELIVKEKVDGVVIDPFNQMDNNYAKHGGKEDKYLEFMLAQFHRFALENQVYFIIVAHPTKLRKPEKDLDYPCPDVFDVAGGAMWNNKMDNILVFHRPFKSSQPDNLESEFHSKKIRRQKIVGFPGMLKLTMDRTVKRFLVNGFDYMKELIEKTTGEKQMLSTPEIVYSSQFPGLQPNKEFESSVDLSQDDNECPF